MSKMLKPTLQVLIVMFTSWVTMSESAYTSPVDELKPIGQSTFKWMFWTVYEGTLYNNSGNYQGIAPGLALKLDYSRSIKADQLIDTTRDQWQELDLYQEVVNESWLKELAELWPDVKKGDSITLLVDENMSAVFYHNGSFAGRLDDSAFTLAFLSIWLGDNVNFPQLRDELLGIS